MMLASSSSKRSSLVRTLCRRYCYSRGHQDPDRLPRCFRHERQRRLRTTLSSSSSSVATAGLASSLNSITDSNRQQHQQQQQQRCYSSTAKIQRQEEEIPETNFSIYEYPTRTEPPIISTTNAKDIDPEALLFHDASNNSKQQYSTKEDPFDEMGTLSQQERSQVKQSQKLAMESLQLSSLPITETVPEFIPPNVPSKELTVPETFITTLDNGIRVVSQETYGQMCTIGVLTNVGSRHEPMTGMIHLLETMAFGSTKSPPDNSNNNNNSQPISGLEIAELLQDWGATRFVSHSREQTLHCIDILRPNVKKGMELLSKVVLYPSIIDATEEFYNAKAALEFQAQEQLPELVLGEAVQVAAYGVEQQLGQLHFATSETIPLLTPNSLEEFWTKNITQNPNGIVIAGAGIDHADLVEMTQQYFGHLTQQYQPMTTPSVYKGGSHYIPNDPNKFSIYGSEQDLQYCRVALAFPVGGWHDESMVTACVLQTLLGGGSSFSAGGPGKGMYSRMYQQVLNRYGWMETAEAFTTFAEEGGLFGVSASTPAPHKIQELVTILADQLARLAIQPVNEIELSRARNMLKCNVLAQLESRLILFEDMGRQVLTYGKRESAQQTCAKIDSVTAEDIQRMVTDMLTTTSPTLAATGSHLDQVPNHEQVSRWFQ